ncbi:MAG: transposase zinc-binding domain-containing protein [Myxococcota bacterium]
MVREHLEEFLRQAREEHGGLPAFVEKNFRAYLACGIPEHGFIRVHCDACGHDDIVAFSCKRRGLCPSCSARAMGTARRTS